MSARTAKDAKLVYGASPRVDLLPPEVADRKKSAALRRSIILGVVGALVLSAGAYTFASWGALEAAGEYDVARAETAALLEEQNTYGAVRTLGDELSTATDAQQAGALTEIDWNAFYTRVTLTLPAGMVIESFTTTSDTPTLDLPGSTGPWPSTRVASAEFVVSTPDLAGAQSWIVALKTLPEYGGAMATSISREEGTGYTVNVTLDLTEAVRTQRFQPVPEPEPTVAPVEESGN